MGAASVALLVDNHDNGCYIVNTTSASRNFWRKTIVEVFMKEGVGKGTDTRYRPSPRESASCFFVL